MISTTLNTDSFNRNQTLTGDSALLRHVFHLVVMKPGTDPLNPNKGCDFNSYYYRLNDSKELRNLEQKIKDQASDYLGYYLRAVAVKAIRVGDKMTLHCFISMDAMSSDILISTNGVTSQLSMVSKT